MTGIVARVLDKGYGFIRADETNKEYFMHATDYVGDWESLAKEVNTKHKVVRVNFEVANSNKGLRAAGVTKIDG